MYKGLVISIIILVGLFIGLESEPTMDIPLPTPFYQESITIEPMPQQARFTPVVFK